MAVDEGEDPHILESNECRDLEERLDWPRD